MPELPEVETVAKELSSAIAPGISVQRVIVRDPSVFRAVGGQVHGPSLLQGLSLERIWRHGKNLLLEWSDKWHLILHFGMSGRVLLLRDVRAGIAMPHERLRVELQSGMMLCFVDPRRFGRAWITRDVTAVLGRLGPDALRVSAGAFCRRVREHARRIKPLLMDQRFVAGVGNIYADEALWRGGIHPLRRSDSLTSAEARGLWRSLRQALRIGIRHRGTSLGKSRRRGTFAHDLAHFVTPLGEPGGNAPFLKVYGRAGQRCFRCGARIQRMAIGSRSSYWCPRCQPL